MLRECKVGPLHVSYDGATLVVTAAGVPFALEGGAAREFLHSMARLGNYVCARCGTSEPNPNKELSYKVFVAGIGAGAKETVGAQLILAGGVPPRERDGAIVADFLRMLPESTREGALGMELGAAPPTLWGSKWGEG